MKSGIAGSRSYFVQVYELVERVSQLPIISYNTEDQTRISKITKALRTHDVNIWYDNGIHKISNEEWQEQIAIHIRDAEVVFFFITQGIFDKGNSFVKKEYELASRHAKQICVVMLDDINPRLIPPKYDFWWGDIQNRQCISASHRSETEIAEEMYKEYYRANRRNYNVQTGKKQSEPIMRHKDNSRLQIVTIILSVLLIAILGALTYSMIGSNSSENPAENPPDSTAENPPENPPETSDDASPAADPAASPAEDPAEETSPYESVILPQSVPDQYYFYNDHTYAFYDAERYHFTTYKEAADFCRDQGGHLAVINDGAENTYLFELLRETSDITAFFGYSDEDNEGDWKWSDGSSNYTNWTTYGHWDLPDNGKEWGGDEDYAEFNYERGKEGIPSDGTWNDAPFMENTSFFICEWDYDMTKAQEYKRSHDN